LSFAPSGRRTRSVRAGRARDPRTERVIASGGGAKRLRSMFSRRPRGDAGETDALDPCIAQMAVLVSASRCPFVRAPTGRRPACTWVPEQLSWTPTGAFGAGRPTCARGHDDPAIATVSDCYSRRNKRRWPCPRPVADAACDPADDGQTCGTVENTATPDAGQRRRGLRWRDGRGAAPEHRRRQVHHRPARPAGRQRPRAIEREAVARAASAAATGSRVLLAVAVRSSGWRCSRALVNGRIAWSGPW